MARKKKEEVAEAQPAAEVAAPAAEPVKETPKPVEEEKPVEELIEDEEGEDEEDEEEGEDEEDEEESPRPKKKSSEIERPDTIKLFNRWSFNDLEISDMTLEKYINLRPVIIPHSGGKHQKKKFWKTDKISVVERFVNKFLSPGLLGRKIKGRGSSLMMGKKQKMLRIFYNAFAIVEEKTGQNPLQILIDAIINSAPREETTRISMGGISYQQAVDISPQRRVDLGIKILVQAIAGQSYNNLRTIDELLANELILAAKNDMNSRAVKKKDELERVAIGAR